MSEEKQRRRALLTDLEAKPWYEYEGVEYPSFPPFREKGTDLHFKDIMIFQSRHTDIIICNYPKSGTHWLREIISLLILQDVKLTEATVTQTMLEIIPDLSTLTDLPAPRLLTTHLSFKYLPQHHMMKGGKVIHLIRNPKDVCVSAYNHYRKDIMVDLNVTWDEFINLWIDGKLPFVTWYEHSRDYALAKLKYPGLVHLIYYEDIIKNPVEEIKSIANFLDIPCTEQLAKCISDVTKFDYMKTYKQDRSNTVTIDGMPFVYRKDDKNMNIKGYCVNAYETKSLSIQGEIGNWKTWFTVSQNERFDEQYGREMTETTYKIVFEP